MDKPTFPASASREPNPLRPYSAYYREPTIGLHPSASPSQPIHAAPRSGAKPPSSSLGSTARDLLPEIDLDLKSSAGEAWQNTRSLFDTLLYRYTSVLLAQPFDVAKTILQVSLPPGSSEAPPQRTRLDPRRRDDNIRNTSKGRSRTYPAEDDEDDESETGNETSESDNEIPDYFTSSATVPPRSRSPRKRRRTPPPTTEEGAGLSPTPTPHSRHGQEAPTHHLNLKRPNSLTHVLSTLYTTSGAVGLWRGTNTTFLYTALLRTTDSFLRSLLLAILGLPDIIGPEQNGLAPALGVTGALGLSGLDLHDSPNPLGSLIVVALSSCITGLLLAPLDLVRTRLIITPTSHQPRGLLANLRHLPSLLPAQKLWLPTTLHTTLPSLFSASTPLLLRSQLQISPLQTPNLWSLASLLTTTLDLFLRLPLETLVRRAQISCLKQSDPDLSTIVPVAEYAGVWGTAFGILFEEGETRGKDARTGMVRVRRGQGVSGLVRGWRVGFWGLVGVWGAGALGAGEARGRGEF
ncbi:hypothetical protein LTR86_003672 [Recurvomyces mirabilis]|nr:hypothetical protein LTR86_003672 [Recurvomyces mirabilis]